MLESQPEVAVVNTVETVETAETLETVDTAETVEMEETGINLLTNRDMVLKNQATCPRPKAEDR